MKTRFAPSPTGEMHTGNARTALFSSLLAGSQKDGKFVLRIEDTDIERSEDVYRVQLMQDLHKLEIYWHEGEEIGGENGPYRQSQRSHIYNQYLQELVSKNLAYPCFCSQEELKEMRMEQKLAGVPPRYSGKWANADPELVKKKKEQGVSYTMRFRVAPHKNLHYEDLVKGNQRFSTDEIGDFVIVKEDGTASFFYANAIDDALMGVTHVLRGDDHLTNTPRQILILEGLGLPIPKYGHLNTILGEDGKPLSKRNGSVSIKQMLAQGWLPSGIINYFARLGHYYSDNALLGMEQLAIQFSIKSLGKSAAKYDPIQLKYWQKIALEACSTQEVWDWIKPEVGEIIDEKNALNFTKVIRDNILFPKDALIYANILTKVLPDYSNEITQCMEQAGKAYFITAQQAWEEVPDATNMIAHLQKMSLKGKALFMPLRAALTGMTHGPEMGSLIDLIPNEFVQQRLQYACEISQ